MNHPSLPSGSNPVDGYDLPDYRAPHQLPYPAAYPNSHGYQTVVVHRGTNALAVATLVLALCGTAILPVILGHIALRQIRARDEAGTGLAISGLVLGYLQIVLYVVFFVMVAGGIWAAVSFG